MSIDIQIGENKKTGIYGHVAGGSHYIAPLVYPVARIIEALFPEIKEKARFIDGYEFINLCELNATEFMIIYKLTKIEFERYCSSFGGLQAVQMKKSEGDYLAKSWLQYMWFLEHDERFSGDEIRDFGLDMSDLT